MQFGVAVSCHKCFIEADFNFATQESNSPKEMKHLSAIVIYPKEKSWHIIG